MTFQKLRIRDICDFVGGAQPPKEVFISEEQEGYIRLIQTRDYKTDAFKTYIPKNLARRFCNKTDIMIGRYGPPIFQILRGLEGAYNVALMKAVPKSNVLNDYLYYIIKQKDIFEYVDKLSARTGGQTGVDLDSLNEYPVLLPNKSYQQKVLGILKGIDDKIVINNRINAELEAIAKTIYDYWFVQFDFPNKNGKPYKASGGKMVWSEELKREIPEGWEVTNILKIGELLGGGTPKTSIASYWDGGIPFFTPSDSTNDFFVVGTEKNITQEGLASCSSDLFEPGNIFITARGTVGKVSIAGRNMAMNQSCYAVAPRKNINTPFLHQCCVNLVHYLKAKGSGSVFDAIVSNDIKLTSISIPPLVLVGKYGNLVSSMYGKMLNSVNENQKLSELRDWLLPMLMNGQVKVGDVEENPDSYREAMAAEPEVAYRKKK